MTPRCDFLRFLLQLAKDEKYCGYRQNIRVVPISEKGLKSEKGIISGLIYFEMYVRISSSGPDALLH
jgi:hypothetical protein